MEIGHLNSFYVVSSITWWPESLCILFSSPFYNKISHCLPKKMSLAMINIFLFILPVRSDCQLEPSMWGPRIWSWFQNLTMSMSYSLSNIWLGLYWVATHWWHAMCKDQVLVLTRPSCRGVASSCWPIPSSRIMVWSDVSNHLISG